MSYDVSEPAADGASAWPVPAVAGPRHRYEPGRAAAVPVPPPSIAAQLRTAPGWNGGTGGQPSTTAAPDTGTWAQRPDGAWSAPTPAPGPALTPAPGPAPTPAPGPAPVARGVEWFAADTAPLAPGTPASPSAPANPLARQVGTTSGEWVQVEPGGEWRRAEPVGDWAATASGEWRATPRRPRDVRTGDYLPVPPPAGPTQLGPTVPAHPGPAVPAHPGPTVPAQRGPATGGPGHPLPEAGAGQVPPGHNGWERRAAAAWAEQRHDGADGGRAAWEQQASAAWSGDPAAARGGDPAVARGGGPIAAGGGGPIAAPGGGPGRPADPPGTGWARSTGDHVGLTGAGQPAATAGPVVRSHDPAAADLRSQVVRRVRFMNFRHAEHAWERRYRDPIGPHALAFLYAEPPRGKPPRFTLKTATRLFLAGPEVDSLPRLLGDLADLVRRAPAGTLDCRTLADRTEEMSPQAVYVGIAVSSLDTPAGPWHDMRQQVAGSIDVPGRCFGLLSDDTMLLMDRGGQSRFGHFEVRSSESLDEIPGDSLQRWTYDRSLPEVADPVTRDIWAQLRTLHRSIVEGGHR